MNKTTKALKLAEDAANRVIKALEYLKTIGIPPDSLDPVIRAEKKVLTAIREALADHIADTGKMIAETVKTYEQGYLDGYDAGLIFANSRVEPVKQEPVGRWNWNEAKFEWLTKFDYHKHHMTPLYAAPQPVMQEPVAWAHPSGGYLSARYMKEFATGLEKETYTIPLYAAPVRTKDLTDDEIAKWFGAATEGSLISFARAVIEKFKEKNRG